LKKAVQTAQEHLDKYPDASLNATLYEGNEQRDKPTKLY